jgi:hypothetical protein
MYILKKIATIAGNSSKKIIQIKKTAGFSVLKTKKKVCT